MEALRQKDGSLLKDLTPPLADLSKQLQLTGVDEALTAQLIKYLQDLPDDTTAQKSESPVEYYRSQSIRWMLKRITIAPKAQATKGNLMISAFVGPSGCGKTSVVAKLASQFSRQQKAKVLIVSLDHQRVGGSEQLRIFAKILGCEFEVIENASELEKAIQSHRDAEVVLIDTAGRSPKNQQKMGDLTDLAKLPIPVEFHLVLSCSERPAHLDRCVRSFSGLSISSLCFTKLDETWSYGDIFNLSTRWSLPLSYFSVGPKIPDDLERATKERVVERIFSL
jgi:flagellar biosynthesis protein FlhF